MKKYLLLTLAGILAITAMQAQDYKIAKSTGKLVINLASVRVEGYNGTEIVFSSEKSSKDDDERAKGLRPINGSGMVDNTNLGISVVDKGATVEVNQVSSKDAEVKIMVPKGMAISYNYNKVMNAGKSRFKNIESEVEISVLHNNIDLDNVSGPLTVKAVYGGVDVKFKENIKGPISLVSIYGHVDVSIPVATKANLTLKTSYGEILAASDLKIDMDKKTDSDMVSYSNNNVKGKLNGGGTDFSVRSDYGKIYLRKNN